MGDQHDGAALRAVHERFKHLDRNFRDLQASENPIHWAAGELWRAVCEAVEGESDG